MEKVKISVNKLKKLYLQEGHSTGSISKIFHCASSTIFYKLRRAGIRLRPRRYVNISKEELAELYMKRKLSMKKIAQLKNCNATIIFDKLRKYGIITRKSKDIAYWKYQRLPFSGDLVEKAYLVGFRLGDLYACKTPQGVYIKTNTTRTEQILLMKILFEKYGHLSVRPYNGEFQMEAMLHQTFFFLAPKQDNIPAWILSSYGCFLAFVAGYTDAEGNIGVYSNRARFRLGSCDKNILHLIHNKLNLMEIRNTLYLDRKAGTFSSGRILNNDFWRINISEKAALKNFLKIIAPYLKHPKRCKDLKEALLNIQKREDKNETNLLYYHGH